MPTTPFPISVVDSPIDFGAYHRPRRIAALHCLPVALGLGRARPLDATPAEERALERVLAAGASVQEIVSRRERLGKSTIRPRLDAFANGWSACAEILGGLARMESERGRVASDVGRILFASGVAFVTRDASAAWAEGQRRLDRLGNENARALLAGVAGDDVLALIEKVTADLGEVIGVGSALPEKVASTALAERVRALGIAITDYARVLGASVETGVPATAARFRRALAPLDEPRPSRTRSSARAEKKASDAEDGRREVVLEGSP